MKHTQKHLENCAGKEHYTKAISELTNQEKEQFESLVIRLEGAGAKDPLSWANSEVNENIPQFGRFLVLKSLFAIAKSVEENIVIAEDLDEKMQGKVEDIKEKIGEEKLYDFLKLYAKGIIYNVIEMLDEGNQDVDRDKISWTLMERDENFEPTGREINGLHESFLGFEDEVE